MPCFTIYIPSPLTLAALHPKPVDCTTVGVGKGIFVSTIGKMLSPYFAHLSSYKQLLGNFNGLIANKTFIFL
jgi:hypothetical protein